MFTSRTVLKLISIFLLSLVVTNCGGSSTTTANSNSQSANPSSGNTDTPATPNGQGSENASIYDIAYKGLNFYHKNMPSSQYTLTSLSDANFNALSKTNKRQVADKLLSTLFFGYPLKELQEKINSGTFISTVFNGLKEDKTDKVWLEEHILDDTIYERNTRNEQVATDILSRFYAMKDLDSYFIHNWSAYILTQTIMFSPAYELGSTHTPNIARVYNRLVNMLKEESGMRYSTYVHMMSEDNWRRFRSPEDNGREMLEIFTLDMDDSHVPLAGQALKNWKLDKESDTLVVSLNQNREPINLFNTSIKNGDDFYREMAKSDSFTFGVTKRLVDFFFSTKDEAKKIQITNTIVTSKPETWQDILLQIVFSEAYLLHSTNPKSAEELFFSTAKKINYKLRQGSMRQFKYKLEKMRQASMKYKLGKLNRVPLDTLSFANYHKFIRTSLLKVRANPKQAIATGNNYYNMGWDASFIANEVFTFNTEDVITSLDSFVQYLFHTIVSRDATPKELSLFKEHMIKEDAGNKIFIGTFDMFITNDDNEKQKEDREVRKTNIAMLVLDYISRLSETYTHKEVK